MAEPTDIRLDRQVAIVTGSGRGIGRAIAQALAAAGASVGVMARSLDQVKETVELINSSGGRAIAAVGDVSDAASVEKIVDATERDLGPVDLLVNNAGINGPRGPIWVLDPKDWNSMLSVNLMGPVICSHVVLRGMVERKSGRIVNITSDSGLKAYPFSTAYSVSKAAVLRFTDSLASDAAAYGVKVFAITPGIVRTSMTEEGWLHMTEGKLPSYARGIPDFPPHSGLTENDWGPAEPIGRTVVAIASGRADALTGRMIDVRDDLDQLIARADEILQKDLYTLRLGRLQPKVAGAAADPEIEARRW